jgi:hypothetical protein
MQTEFGLILQTFPEGPKSRFVTIRMMLFWLYFALKKCSDKSAKTDNLFQRSSVWIPSPSPMTRRRSPPLQDVMERVNFHLDLSMNESEKVGCVSESR